MLETSKAMRRRLRDPMFASTYFVGHAIDIGSGNDPLSSQLGYWPLLKAVDEWEFAKDGDAQIMKGVPNKSYDLVYSSHCLEHVRDAGVALSRWMEILKPNGHLVVTVPDFDMYERGSWPSRFNPDHKTRFTFFSVSHLLLELAVIKVERIIEGFDPAISKDIDQTQTGAECAIEMIVRRDAR